MQEEADRIGGLHVMAFDQVHSQCNPALGGGLFAVCTERTVQWDTFFKSITGGMCKTIWWVQWINTYTSRCMNNIAFLQAPAGHTAVVCNHIHACITLQS